MLETLEKVRYGITNFTFFVLFDLILKLLSIFMVMINIVKIELINGTENYLSNTFSVTNK